MLVASSAQVASAGLSLHQNRLHSGDSRATKNPGLTQVAVNAGQGAYLHTDGGQGNQGQQTGVHVPGARTHVGEGSPPPNFQQPVHFRRQSGKHPGASAASPQPPRQKAGQMRASAQHASLHTGGQPLKGTTDSQLMHAGAAYSAIAAQPSNQFNDGQAQPLLNHTFSGGVEPHAAMGLPAGGASQPASRPQ